MPSHFSSPNSSTIRVLVVEDEALIANYLQDLLTDLGHECVGPFGRLDDALHQAQNADMDAAILDIIIAGKTAYPVAEILACREVPFGFASGLPLIGLDAKWQGRPYLDKPYSLDGVRELVLTLLDLAPPPKLPRQRASRHRHKVLAD